ncbi:MAG: hypothetical protein WCO52_04945 [bacterium]
MTTTQKYAPIGQVEARIARLAPRLYPQLPYHNWPHGSEVAEIMGKLSQVIGENEWEQACDRMAGWLHDGLYPYNAGEHEPFIAATSRRYLERFGAAPDVVDRVGSTIEASSHAGPLVKPYHHLMRAADLCKLAGPYDGFLTNWNNLREEAAILSGAKEVDPLAFNRGSVGFLGLFLKDTVRLTQNYYDTNGASAFHVAAMANIIRRSQEVWKDAGGELRVVGEWGCGRYPVIIDHCSLADPKVLFVGLEIDPVDLGFGLKAMGLANKFKKDHAPTGLILPGERHGISLPDNSLDELYLRNGWQKVRGSFPIKEMARVLKPGGVAKIIETYDPEGGLETGGNRSINLDQIQASFDQHGLRRVSLTELTDHGFCLVLSKS